MAIQRDVGKNYSYRSDAEHYEHSAVGDVATGRRFKAVQQVPIKVRNASDGTYKYYGFAAPGTATSSALWRVLREEISTGDLDFADGNDDFDNIWDNYSSLSYS